MTARAMAGAVFEVPVLRMARPPALASTPRTPVLSRRRRQVTARCRRLGRAV